MSPLRRQHRQGVLAWPRVEARQQATTELSAIGAGFQYTRPLSLLEATEPPALPTATSLTTRGPLRGAEAITLVEGTLEAEATASSEVAGGGRGAAGRPQESAANIEAAP